MSSVFKFFSLLLTSFLFLITGFFLFSQLNFFGNYKIYLVQSGSMSPAINTGDLVVVKPNLKYKKGDIITFSSKNNFNITHRIVEIKNNKVETKGDANQVTDQDLIDIDKVLGKVFYIIPYFGYLIIFIKTIPGLIILIIIPSTIIVYTEFIQIKNNIKKMSN